ncbi:phospholipid-transporting ATPase ABCA3-like [Amphiura filiformis]|uniref:phospholipid-transporting ATPase ABCA3-like n=1 Tax=Amphiura filiformis TaxID=82378 RepID=UPI003B2274A0
MAVLQISSANRIWLFIPVWKLYITLYTAKLQQIYHRDLIKMALGAFKQFILLSWKNWMLQKRKVWTTLFELGFPLLFSAILLIIRNFVPFEDYQTPTTYEAFEIDKLPNSLLPPDATSGWPPYFWKLAYAPNDTIVGEIMEKTVENLQFGPVVRLSDSIGYPTEEELLDYFAAANSSISNVLGGIVFHNEFSGDSIPSDPTYSIRLSANPKNAPLEFMDDATWLTTELFPFYQFPGPREKNYTDGGMPGYLREGFLSLQYAIDKAIMELKGGNNNHTTLLQRYPYPPYFYDTYILILQTSFPDLIMLSLVFVALNIAKSITHEKETKLKESMKMMGLSGWIHWAAWFVKSFVYLLITISVMTLFFSIKVGKNHAAVVNNSDKSIVFIFLLLYAISTICFSFAISTMFTRANSAAVAAGVLFLLTYMPYYFILFYYSNLTLAGKLSSALLHNTCMGLGGLLLGLYEGTGEGIQYSNINVPFSVDDDLTFLHILLMFMVDIVFYSSVCWYVEAVFPGDYGVPQPWYFPFTQSYWCGSPTVTEVYDAEGFMMESKNAEFFEADPSGVGVGISIRNLKKVFQGHDGVKVAVNGMSLNMYEGQITALLGHNGAGKTTTMSMLTGLFPPTSGTAIVNGCNIKTNLQGVRSSLGLCPQHDVLFGDLTVEEHLYFFAKLKGLDSKTQVQSEIEHYLSSMGLEDKRNQFSKSLSGGMKRKLSCGIALIADSKVVMLDEPTSGMDPDARRSTWDLLQRHREGRTILLTTHHMDEADLLGDRIAIMAEGELQCCGSSLFLKKKYGVGYHMVCVKDSHCDVSQVTNLVTSLVPNAGLESNIGAELSYVLPHESSANFESLFTNIETNKTNLGISSYGASITTMEEVFIKVGEKSDHTIEAKLHHIDEGKETLPDSSSASSEDSCLKENTNTAYGALPSRSKVSPITTGNDSNVHMDTFGSTDQIIKSQINANHRNTGVALYFQQFYAMLLKHALHSLRNITVALVQLALPLIFVAIAIILVSLFPSSAPQPPLEMTAAIYRASIAQYSCGENASTPLTESLCDKYAAYFKDTTETTNIDDETAIPHDMMEYLLKFADDAINSFNSQNLVSATFQDSGEGEIVSTAWFNNQPFHCPPLALNAIHNAYAKHYIDPNFKITTINHPLPPNLQQQVQSESESFGTGSLVAFQMITGLSFLASSFAVFLITENTSKAKHLQFVSGVQLSNFWLSTYLWDIINFMIPSLLICLMFWAAGVDSYGTDGRVWITLLILFLTGWAIIPFTYLLSFLFREPATGYIRVLLINQIGTFIFYFLYELLALEGLNLKSVADILQLIFLLMPLYTMGEAFETFYMQYSLKEVCTSFPPYSQIYCDVAGIPWETDYLAWGNGGIGVYLVFLGVGGFFYFGLVFLVESQLIGKIKHHYARKRYQKTDNLIYSESGRARGVEEDEDVAAERKRITTLPMSQLEQDNMLIVKNLRKVYSLRGMRGNLLAVEDICVGVPQGECFGLLGINGAGKTSTFKMLTGDEAVTAGSAYLKGYSIKSDIKKVQQLIGYCPQFDALIDQMTGRETLTMYGRLRGLSEKVIPLEVDRLLKALMLEPHADKFTKTYSGGNKRKLSTAIALMGDPPIVFLDEPTTGLDPVAKRLMWDTICKVRDSGKSIILTSHSMEECEALCTRLAIMVNGQFKCLGSQQHLKNRFGAGFTVLAKSKFGQDLSGFKVYMERTFPGCKLKDEHQGMVHYHITDVSLHWAQIFGSLEKAKTAFDIEDYSVSQTSLEQVFLNFARVQREDVGDGQR